MPELPDITVYVERLRELLKDRTLRGIRFGHPFILRTVAPAVHAFVGKKLVDVTRRGKRIILEFENHHFAVIHLMIAGRLHWRKPDAPVGRRGPILAFDFEDGTLVLTEAGSKRRASLHLAHGAGALNGFDRGGINIFSVTPQKFSEVLKERNRTLKRALTDPSVVDGIGNAYSDEILHRAALSPFRKTHDASDEELGRLHGAAVEVMQEWIERLRSEAGDELPRKVTAFRPEMAVHGKYGQLCPRCGAPVQRIVYAENEANYCPGCQTGGKVFSDRALSRLLKGDWPRTLDELEAMQLERSSGSIRE